MTIHPGLARPLAEAKIEQVRSQTRRVAAQRAASPDRRTDAVAIATRRHGWAVPTPATIRRWRARRAHISAS